MTILCIGKNGQVARSLHEVASSTGISLVARGRDQLNLLNPNSILKNIRELSPSILINAAAYTAVDEAERDIESAMDLNARASQDLAEIAEDLSIPLIHYSTDYVFNGMHSEPYSEDHEESPTSVYGASKLMGEHAITRHTSRYVILRTAWVYGPYGKNFIKTMLRLAKERDEVSVVNDQIGNPTCSIDIACATLQICQHIIDKNDACSWGTYNMTGSGSASWAEFAEEAFKVSATLNVPVAVVKPVKSVEYPSPVKRPMNSRLDCSKLKATYGIVLPDWQQSLATTVDRLINNGK